MVEVGFVDRKGKRWYTLSVGAAGDREVPAVLQLLCKGFSRMAWPGRKPKVSETIRATVMRGSVTVAYRQVNEEWHCTALEFDIIGVGASRKESFEKMKNLVSFYLGEVSKAIGPVEFFNRSPDEDWQISDKEEYNVIVVMIPEQRQIPERLPPDLPSSFDRLPELCRFDGYVASFDLVRV